ncbi:MAG: M48 family metallopeptidase [Marinifilaceae bacterium]
METNSIEIRRSANIKYLSIRMAPGRGIWVNVPYGVSEDIVKRFISEKREWIEANKAKIKAYEQRTSTNFDPGAEIVTKMHRIRVETVAEKQPRYTMKGSDITFHIPSIMTSSQRNELMQQMLVNVYKYEAKRYLTPRIVEWSAKLALPFARLSFRNNISNWGSCSHQNDISLNVKLMKLPDALIDYVIIHELCHVKEKNHSASFWALVEKHCPNYAKLRAELKKHHTRI